MATKTCPTCGGSGYNSMGGVIPGSQKGAQHCSTCSGSGWVYDNSSQTQSPSSISGRPGRPKPNATKPRSGCMLTILIVVAVCFMSFLFA